MNNALPETEVAVTFAIVKLDVPVTGGRMRMAFPDEASVVVLARRTSFELKMLMQVPETVLMDESKMKALSEPDMFKATPVDEFAETLMSVTLGEDRTKSVVPAEEFIVEFETVTL